MVTVCGLLPTLAPAVTRAGPNRPDVPSLPHSDDHCGTPAELLPADRLYRVQGKALQDCRDTEIDAIVTLPQYKVDVIGTFDLEPLCPRLRARTESRLLASPTTDDSGAYAIMINSNSMNAGLPRTDWRVKGTTISVFIKNSETGDVLARSASTPLVANLWRPNRRGEVFAGTTTVGDVVVETDCPSSRAEDPGDPVWRLQLEIWTGPDGTGDLVSVSLNAQNRTYLDYGHQDFQSNSHFTYDLNLSGVSRMEQIVYIKLSTISDSIYRSDPWTVRRLRLLINGAAAYDRSWAVPVGASYRTVTSNELRSSPLWRDYDTPVFPRLVTNDELVQRFEGYVGHWVHANRHLWRTLANDLMLGGSESHGDALEISRKTDRSLEFDLDFTATKCEFLFCFDLELDIDGEVLWRCNDEDEDSLADVLEIYTDGVSSTSDRGDHGFNGKRVFGLSFVDWVSDPVQRDSACQAIASSVVATPSGDINLHDAIDRVCDFLMAAQAEIPNWLGCDE